VRESDIWLAVVDALQATKQFDDVWDRGMPEDAGEPASEKSAASIEPRRGSLKQYGDAAPDGGLDITSQITITVLYRHIDIELRDRGAERLLNVVFNTLNGNSLGGLIFAQTALVRDWEWLTPTVPERRIRTAFYFEYLIEGWNNFDVTD
jgi:hypothetical protein